MCIINNKKKKKKRERERENKDKSLLKILLPLSIHFYQLLSKSHSSIMLHFKTNLQVIININKPDNSNH